MTWRDIESAPRDGAIFLTYWSPSFPVMVAWVERPCSTKVEYSGVWPFRKRRRVKVLEDAGWHVLMPGRDLTYGVHGNFYPFEPTHWMPLPEPPKETE